MKAKKRKEQKGFDLIDSALKELSANSEILSEVPLLAALSPTNNETFVSQTEALRIAQNRLQELERELERLRDENEQLTSTNSSVKNYLIEIVEKNCALEKKISQTNSQYQSKIKIYKSHISSKKAELSKAKVKIDELEGRLRQDFRKIHVRERDLENRLELSQVEKETLLRAKDDAILDLKRKLEQTSHDLTIYREKVGELHRRVETNNEQFGRTIRTLRLALTNLELNDSSTVSVKKAE